MEDQETSESDPCQGKLQKDLDFVHIPMYIVLEVKPMYYMIKGLKVAYSNFHMFLGMV